MTSQWLSSCGSSGNASSCPQRRPSSCLWTRQCRSPASRWGSCTRKRRTRTAFYTWLTVGRTPLAFKKQENHDLDRPHLLDNPPPPPTSNHSPLGPWRNGGETPLRLRDMNVSERRTTALPVGINIYERTGVFVLAHVAPVL
ncbi:hypothetical protein F7725_026677 [Dissostichus mawsoni]|uniref:Uncharacterized protein n=1 Tax=Dissostichus mawsoni TaxID=36200 RepID=A0A7J5X7Q9_DISMA|nr:hypothetical protein F7725_026677 [Dissostichus mawsoni]